MALLTISLLVFAVVAMAQSLLVPGEDRPSDRVMIPDGAFASGAAIVPPPQVTIQVITLLAPDSDGSSEGNAYTHLYTVMDKYATNDTLRLLDSYERTATWDDGDVAWVYDNALVMMAFMTRGTDDDWQRAKVLADSLIYAQEHDPEFSDGRVRDAYYAGNLIDGEGKARVAAPGSGLGNMAFTILAWLRYYEHKGGAVYLQAAERLGNWIYDNFRDTRGAGGYTGGLDSNGTRHQWKSTEHNIDGYAAFMKLYETTREPKWRDRAMEAKRFIRAMWNPVDGHFWTGTLNDGATVNPYPIPEDVQSWGLMVMGEPPRYGAGLAWAENNLLLDPCPSCAAFKGFKFSDAGSGCWWEGTAHMALAYQVKGENAKADEYVGVLRSVQSSATNGNGQGIVSACPGGADSGFGGTYPNALHIGAAAWYLFAERGHNPYWGTSTGQPVPYEGLYDDIVLTLARDTWRYLSSDWATDNHLPWSWRSTQIAGGDYANPAEIGFHMLSYIGAYEMHEPWSPSWTTVEAEISATLAQLETWQNSNNNSYNKSVFYQWYWINADPPRVGDGLADHVVPAIDNAWLAASLIAIREYAEANGHAGLAQQANGVLQDMDFTLWHSPTNHLFNWGAFENPQGGGFCDYYSNENRIINFVARALDQLNETEFRASLWALTRDPKAYDRGSPGRDDDIIVSGVNWDGSYFTYAAPALFIKEVQTPYGDSVIHRATEAQITYAQDKGYLAWGISDAFGPGDSGYQERGAPPRGSCNPYEDEDDGLITPHASGLALISAYTTQAITNLQTLSDTCPSLYDPTYGFKDSVNVLTCTVSQRFSTLSQEWIFLALMNHRQGTIWDYFYRDEGVRQAHEEMYGLDINGMNYYAKDHAWQPFWQNYPIITATVDDELAIARSWGVNSVRTFLPYNLFSGASATTYLPYLQDFVSRCAAHGMKVVITLFDFYPSHSPNPYDPTDYANGEAHIRGIVNALGADNETVLAWDIKNEIDRDYAGYGEEKCKAWADHMIAYLRTLDARHLITVETYSVEDSVFRPEIPAYYVTGITHTVDLLSTHYFLPENDFQANLAALKAHAGGKPVIIGEFGLHTYTTTSAIANDFHTEQDQATYYNAILSLAEAGNAAGTMFWTLNDFTTAPGDERERHMGILRNSAVTTTENTTPTDYAWKPAAYVVQQHYGPAVRYLDLFNGYVNGTFPPTGWSDNDDEGGAVFMSHNHWHPWSPEWGRVSLTKVVKDGISVDGLAISPLLDSVDLDRYPLLAVDVYTYTLHDAQWGTHCNLDIGVSDGLTTTWLITNVVARAADPINGYSLPHRFELPLPWSGVKNLRIVFRLQPHIAGQNGYSASFGFDSVAIHARKYKTYVPMVAKGD